MKNKSLVISVILILFVGLIWTYMAMIFNPQREEIRHISVVVCGSNDSRWNAVKAGMQQAGRDYGIDVDYVATAQYMSGNDQWDLIQNQIRENIDGVILEPVGYIDECISANTDMIGDLPIVLIGGDMEPQGAYDCVKLDDVDLGKRFARELYFRYGEKLREMKLGIVCGENSGLMARERLKGFYEGLEEQGINDFWTLGLGKTLDKSLEQQIERSRPNIIVALGTVETEVTIKVIEEMEETGIHVWGEGYSEKNVYYLEKGMIDCLLMPNDYYMGYLAVQRMYELLEHQNSKNKTEILDVMSISRKDVYKEEYQRVLFPRVQ